jgi:hypothetical protein
VKTEAILINFYNEVNRSQIADDVIQARGKPSPIRRVPDSGPVVSEWKVLTDNNEMQTDLGYILHMSGRACYYSVARSYPVPYIDWVLALREAELVIHHIPTVKLCVSSV